MKQRINKRRVLSILLSSALLFGTVGDYTCSSAAETTDGTSLENARELWLNFDEENCEDFSGKNVATVTAGTMAYETGHDGKGKALVLNDLGKNYVGLGKSAPLQSKSITVSAWVTEVNTGVAGNEFFPAGEWIRQCFTGNLDEVAVYSRGATQDEIYKLAGIETDADKVAATKEKLTIEETVSDNFSLPLSGEYSSKITLKASNPAIEIKSDGAATVTVKKQNQNPTTDL